MGSVKRNLSLGSSARRSDQHLPTTLTGTIGLNASFPGSAWNALPRGSASFPSSLRPRESVTILAFEFYFACS